MARIVRGPRAADNFTIIANAALRDGRLTFKARGVLAYLLSMETGWETSLRRLAVSGVDGRDAVDGALHELEKFGYLERREVRHEAGDDKRTGTFAAVEYHVVDEVGPSRDAPRPAIPDTVDGTVSGLTGHGPAGPGKSATKKNSYKKTSPQKTSASGAAASPLAPEAGGGDVGGGSSPSVPREADSEPPEANENTTDGARSAAPTTLPWLCTKHQDDPDNEEGCWGCKRARETWEAGEKLRALQRMRTRVRCDRPGHTGYADHCGNCRADELIGAS